MNACVRFIFNLRRDKHVSQHVLRYLRMVVRWW